MTAFENQELMSPCVSNSDSPLFHVHLKHF